MLIISHRGNLQGSNIEEENNPNYIDKAISSSYDVDVEIDAWYLNNKLYLGHDGPQYSVNEKFLLDRKTRLWVHAKNSEALRVLDSLDINCFWHTDENYVFTKFGKIWVYPGVVLFKGCIAVLPETVKYTEEELKQCYAICTDAVADYKEAL